jgi:hypothetical protein
MVRGGKLKERDPLFELVLKWITQAEVRALPSLVLPRFPRLEIPSKCPTNSMAVNISLPLQQCVLLYEAHTWSHLFFWTIVPTVGYDLDDA